MMLFDDDPGLFHLDDHLATDVLLCVRGSHREIALLVAELAAQIKPLLPHVPCTFLGIEKVVPAIAGLIVAGMVEDEEFGFRPPKGCISDLSALKILFSLLGNKPGVP